MRLLLGLFALLCATAGAEAKHHKTHLYHHTHHARLHHFHHTRTAAIASVTAQPQPHPEGCPHTDFCGCGVSVRVYGHSVRSLWQAASWYKFPRTTPQAGTVAIFGRRHVAFIEQMLGTGIALVYDPNNGHHRTRIHPRSIAGATIVKPT